MCPKVRTIVVVEVKGKRNEQTSSLSHLPPLQGQGEQEQRGSAIH